jgi:predicted metalloprotease with PDZ domain
MKKLLLLVVLVSLWVPLVSAQKPKKNAAPATGESQAITLFVDASESPRKILHARLSIPAQPGPLTLYYPKWLPGEHGPNGPVYDLAGLHFAAGGKEIAWRRDLLDMWTFHMDVPAGANAVEVNLDYLEPASGAFSGGAGASDQMAVISWNELLLYPLPQGNTSRDIMFQPNLHLPAGWKYGTSLEVAGGSGADVEFAPVSLEMLVDSPVIAGRYFKQVVLHGDPIRHVIDIAGDSAAAVEMPPALQDKYSNLVMESGALYGARHYNHYDFLLTLSDHTAHFGLEHHQSSDNRVPEESVTDADAERNMAGLLPHEMTHSWNGKYRRPADLATPDFQKPMQTDLLWVYEGLTNYFGYVLTGRSGLLTPEEERDSLAITAAQLDYRAGREWRPLQDTADAAQVVFGHGTSWPSWRRGADFYDESTLIWLEADTQIRQLTGNKKSMDDFAHLFHGGKNTPPEVVPYTFDDVVKTLNQVAPYDWAKFLRDRLDFKGQHAPLGGITNGGWKLVYDENRSPIMRIRERKRNTMDLTFSIGITLSTGRGESDGMARVTDVIPGMAAAKAGIGPGMRIIAVNGRAYMNDLMRSAVAATKSGAPLELLCENDDYFHTYKIEYSGGARYPHLVRDESHPDLLDEIIKPHAAQVHPAQ